MPTDYPDFEGGKQALYLTPAWAALVGNEKHLGGSQTNRAWSEYASFSYTVPAGKTLYVTEISWEISAYIEEDADNNQFGSVWIWNHDTLNWDWYQGSNGGDGVVFAIPKVYEAGVQITIYCYCLANHACSVAVNMSGFEV